jgi:hypothetical protein
VRRPVALVAVALATGFLASTGTAGAAFTTHMSNPQTFTAASAPPSHTNLVAQSRTNDGGAASSQIQYGLRLKNVGSQPVDLSTVKMRYWLTTDGSTALPVTACYYAAFDCAKVQQHAVDLHGRRENADHYVEVAFTGGQLAAGAAAQLDQLAIRDPGGAIYTQTNDHSFLNQGSFTDNSHVTVYVDGKLAWGSEPPALPAVESVEVQYSNLDPDPQNNAINPGLKVENTGTVDLDPARLTLRYWFTAEGTSPLLGFCDYADLGCPKVTTTFGKVNPARPGADSYLQVGFAAGLLETGTSTGQLQLRVHKSDFSNFDERDDFSRGTNTTFATTTTVTAYLDGKLVGGTEP